MPEIKDIRNAWKTKFLPAKFTEDERASMFASVREEYLSQSHDPETITHIWEQLWAIWNRGILRMKTITPCSKTAMEISALEYKGRMLIYVPPRVSTGKDFVALAKLFPDQNFFWFMRSDRHHMLQNINQSGWIDTEAALETPNLLSDQLTPYRRSLIDVLDTLTFSKGRSGLTVNSYAIASEFAKVIYGRYLDQETMSYLPGSYHPDFLVLGVSKPNGTVDYEFFHQYTYYWARKFPRNMGIRTSSIADIKGRKEPDSLDDLGFNRLFGLPPEIDSEVKQ